MAGIEDLEEYELVELPALNGEGPRYKYVKKKPEGKFDLTRKFYERARRSKDPLGYDDYQEVKDKFGMYAPIVAKGAKTGDALLRGIMGLGYGASGLVGDITGNELLARDLAGMFESAGGRLGSPGTALTAPYRAGTTLGKAKVKQVADDIASDIKYAPEIIKGEASSVALGAKQPQLTSAGAAVSKQSELNTILAKLDADFNPSSPHTKMHNTKKQVVTYKYNNPKATTDEVWQHFKDKGIKVSRGSVGNYIDEAGLKTTGILGKTEKEIELIRKKFYEYKKANENVAPSMTQLSDYMGLPSSGGVSKISRIKDGVQKNHGYDPFEGLNFKLGTATKEGRYTPTEITRLKNIEKNKFMDNPNVPDAIKNLRKNIEKTIKSWNKNFPDNKMALDHINSYWNSLSKKSTYEGVENWNIIGKKLNSLKAAVYENPQTGLLRLKDKLKTAKNKTEQRAIQKLYDEQFKKHQKLVEDSNVLLELGGIDAIPNKFIRYAEKFPSEKMTVEKLTKQLDEMQNLINQEKANILGKLPNTSEMAMGMMGMSMKKGGRVGHKEGGLVKPKINPADYIEYYRDGTKLYKINSFIRDIASQIA